jgi:uncharacterized protein (TIGR03435 family)
MTRSILIVVAWFAAFGQTASPPTFEAASVKVNKSGNRNSSTTMNSDDNSAKLAMQNVTLMYCIQRALGVREYQVSGPDWLKSEKYDIVGVGQGMERDQIGPMLQKLLVDRFQLKFHRET